MAHGHINACLSLQTGNPADCRCAAESTHYFLFAAYSFVLSVFQMLCAFFTNSTSLMSDGIHQLFDGSEFLISGIASVMVRKHHEEKSEDIIRRRAGYWSAALLMVAVVGILYEGVHRLFHPEEVSGWVVLFAGISLAVVIKLIFVHHNIPAEHRNITSLWNDTHLRGDALSSLAVLLGGVTKIITGWLFIDPLIGIAIGLRISWMVYKRLTTLPSAEKTPAEQDTSKKDHVHGENCHHKH